MNTFAISRSISYIINNFAQKHPQNIIINADVRTGENALIVKDKFGNEYYIEVTKIRGI